MANVNANDNRGTLEAISKGLITLRGAEANNNWDFGMHLRNNFKWQPQASPS